MTTTEPIICAIDHEALIQAATKLLDARENKMLTKAHWEALEAVLGRGEEPSIDPTDIFDVTHDFQIASIKPRSSAPGYWVKGSTAGHQFDALVFTENAENPDWEIADSQISKLAILRKRDKKIVYNWDRGLDVPAVDPLVQTIVDFLTVGLKDCVCGDDE